MNNSGLGAFSTETGTPPRWGMQTMRRTRWSHKGREHVPRSTLTDSLIFLKGKAGACPR